MANTVLITGFGPFAQQKINASWEVAKELLNLNTEEELGIKLIIQEIPVSYDDVAKIIPSLWDKHKPMLVVHLGVAYKASELTLESCAHKSGYCLNDICGNVPVNGTCTGGSCEKKETAIDLELVKNEVNKSDIGMTITVSSDAGRYLCEFIYYTSLCVNDTCTVFIHVPDIDEPYSVTQLANGLKKILTVILNQISKKN